MKEEGLPMPWSTTILTISKASIGSIERSKAMAFSSMSRPLVSASNSSDGSMRGMPSVITCLSSSFLFSSFLLSSFFLSSLSLSRFFSSFPSFFLLSFSSLFSAFLLSSFSLSSLFSSFFLSSFSFASFRSDFFLSSSLSSFLSVRFLSSFAFSSFLSFLAAWRAGWLLLSSLLEELARAFLFFDGSRELSFPSFTVGLLLLSLLSC
mmetsp:Transcript_49994/g.116820  ORF Transcript_49994/g.116820 Transcript_49994/m.116820 type:complete len:207 (-) Transcript_49994:564-1184(-)